MRPVEVMTYEELVAEAKALQSSYEARLAQASEMPWPTAMADIDGDLSRYFDVRSELQRREGGPLVDGTEWPPDGAW